VPSPGNYIKSPQSKNESVSFCRGSNLPCRWSWHHKEQRAFSFCRGFSFLYGQSLPPQGKGSFFLLPRLQLLVRAVAASTRKGKLYPFAEASLSLWWQRPSHLCALMLKQPPGGRPVVAWWFSMWCAKHVWRLLYAAKQHQSDFQNSNQRWNLSAPNLHYKS